MSRGLKILARELNVPVIALSQLSRARRVAHRQAAAAVGPARVRPDRAGRRPRDVHLPRRVLPPGDTERPGEADLIIAKHRNGGLGDVRSSSRASTRRFMTKQPDGVSSAITLPLGRLRRLAASSSTTRRARAAPCGCRAAARQPPPRRLAAAP